MKSILKLLIAIMLLAPSLLFSSTQKESKEVELSQGYYYPLTVTDSRNREITISKEPKSLVSLNPGITEIIYALNSGDLLVGRTDYCDYPEIVANVTSVGSLMEPNIEKIVELSPDIIFAGTHFSKEVLNKLEEAGQTVILIQEEESLEGVYTCITSTGKYLNKNKEAENIVSDMKFRIDFVKNTIKGNKPTVYYVIGFGEYGDYTPGGDTFISDLIELAGGVNIANDSVGWSYSLEKIIENDPYIVICSQYYGTPEQLKQATGYRDLPAILENRLYPIDNNILDRQGPRIAQGIETMAKIFYPGLFE